jgi:hypothetical protein
VAGGYNQIRMKKPGLAIAAVLVVAWLGLWASNYGLLVYSEENPLPKTRDCRYFIGVTVLKRPALLADRCPLIRKVGN